MIVYIEDEIAEKFNSNIIIDYCNSKTTMSTTLAVNVSAR